MTMAYAGRPRRPGDGALRTALRAVSCLAAAVVVPTAPVAAQSVPGFAPFLESDIPFDPDRGRNVSVLERPRPEYAPIGIRSGAFIVMPSVDTGIGYTSNVYGSRTGAISDGFAEIDPALAISSDWSRHSLSLNGGAKLKRYFHESLKNESGLYINGTGRYDISTDADLVAQGDLTRAYEAQYSGAFPTASGASVRYIRKHGLLRGRLTSGRFRFLASGDYTDLTFRDTKTLAGGTLAQGFRDRSIARTSGRVEYALSPAIAGFAQVTYSDSNYKQLLLGGPNRDNQEWRVLGGVTFDLTALARANVGVGYVRRKFKAQTFGSLSGLAADARVIFFPDSLTTLTFAVRRQVEDASITGSSGFFLTALDARVDHEILRNLLVNVSGSYERDKFEEVTRRDRLFRIGGGFHYMPFSKVNVDLDVQKINRRSTGAPIGQAFDETRGILTFSLQV